MRKQNIFWKKVIAMGAFLLGSILLGVLLLYAVFLIPTQRMKGHLQASIPLLVDEFSNSNVIYNYPSTLTGLFTDCIMLENAVYEKESSSPLKSAMEVYRGEKQEEYWTPGEALVAYLNGEELPVEVSYARYWHGYLILLKPLLLFLDVGELRMIGMLLQGLMGLAVFWGFYRRRAMAYGMVFGFTVLWMMPLSMMLSLSLSVCYYLMLIGILAILFFHEKWEKIGYEWLFLVLGVLTAYFDFLTYPLVTLGIPLCVWVLLQTNKTKYTICKLTGNGISWAAGYGIMWAGKWVVGDLFAGSGVIKDALETLTARTGKVEQQSRLGSFVTAIKANLGAVENFGYLLLILAAIAVIAASWYALHQKKRKERISFYKAGTRKILPNDRQVQKDSSKAERIESPEDKENSEGIKSLESKESPEGPQGFRWGTLCYLFLAVLPFGWFLVTANHSTEHWMFTFRITGISVFALLSGAVYWLEHNQVKDTKCEKKF